MKSTDKAKRVPIADVAEVQELQDLATEIEALKAEHPDVFMKYVDLVDRYNSKLEEAEQKVRALGVTCGPFDNYSVSVTINPQKMYDEIGHDRFLEVGGTISQVSQYAVDPAKVAAAIASGKIPEACVDEFREVKRSYHKPKPKST